MSCDNIDVEQNIPAINFSEDNMKPGSDLWKLASKKVREGLEEYGCFEVVLEDFPQDCHNALFVAAKELHDLPTETKSKKVTSRPNAKNYIQRNGPNAYESMGIDDPHTLQGAQLITTLMWPQGNDIFCETVHEFSKRLVKITEMTTRMVAENYGINMEKYRSITESSFNSLRFLQYKSEVRNESNVVVGLATHTDSSFMSIIHQHEIGDLQIQSNGDHWIDVKPTFSSFLVIAGDVLQAWSNDRIKACAHRVIIKKMNIVRHSVGLFMILRGIVSVPEELVDEEHPLIYKPFNHFEYLSFFIKEESRKLDCPIKTFCGICDQDTN